MGCELPPRGSTGAEHRQMIAHGVSSGFDVRNDHQPQRGDRRGRLQCTEGSREAAKPRRGQDVVSRRDAGIAEGNPSSSAVRRVGDE